MKTWLVVLLLSVTQSAMACRIVCSKGSDLWHLLADGETDKFQVLEGSNPINQGLSCKLLPAVGSAAEQEELRLINVCTLPLDKSGETERFRTERAQVRKVVLEEGKPREVSEDQLVWIWERDVKNPKSGKTEIKTLRRVEFDRNDCGSAKDS